MKLALSFVIIVLLSASAPIGVVSAQEATLATPIPRASCSKYKVERFDVSTTPVNIFIRLQCRDSGNAEVPGHHKAFSLPDDAFPAATVVSFLTALDTVRATETGNIGRKMEFRIVGYLSDQGMLTGVTLVP